MFLRFIGTDKSMGLKHGEVYHCTLSTYGGCILVAWEKKGVTKTCPYSSLKTLTENWETVEWEQKSN